MVDLDYVYAHQENYLKNEKFTLFTKVVICHIVFPLNLQSSLILKMPSKHMHLVIHKTKTFQFFSVTPLKIKYSLQYERFS